MVNGEAKQLRQVLLADGLTSGATGLGLVVMPGMVAGLVGAPSAGLVAAIGAGLVLFGLGLVWTSRRGPTRGGTLYAASLNIAWVVGTVVVVLAGGLNAIGNWALILVGIVVLAFAVLELRYLPAPSGRAEGALGSSRARA